MENLQYQMVDIDYIDMMYPEKISSKEVAESYKKVNDLCVSVVLSAPKKKPSGQVSLFEE